MIQLKCYIRWSSETEILRSGTVWMHNPDLEGSNVLLIYYLLNISIVVIISETSILSAKITSREKTITYS